MNNIMHIEVGQRFLGRINVQRTLKKRTLKRAF